METTLYERLGGEQGVRKLANDIADNHLVNPLIKTRFEQIEDLDAVKNLVFEFIYAGTGGPQTYTGKGMLGAHKGMNISEQEFIAVVDDIMLAMDQNNLGEAEKKDMLAIGYSLKEEIIRVQLAFIQIQSRDSSLTPCPKKYIKCICPIYICGT